MGWFSDDITFCANKECDDMRCCRNPKNIKHIDIPHSFALYTRCWNWSDRGAEWLVDRMCRHASIFGNIFVGLTLEDIERIKNGEIVHIPDEYGTFIGLMEGE